MTNMRRDAGPIIDTASKNVCRPVFLITIDTEGDNIWARRPITETRNAGYLARFQELCERHALKPTYLTNYEMAKSPAFRELALDALRHRTAEVGMHLHAWNSPPVEPITADDNLHHPFLIDYPEPLMQRKVAYMTSLLEDTFGVRMRSHRAGRWAFNETYARILLDHGYEVDCSVTPGHSWADTPGAPRRFGSDYSRFPAQPYWIDSDRISNPGYSNLLELPVTIRMSWLAKYMRWVYHSPVGRIVRRAVPEESWIRPNGRNLNAMRKVIAWSLKEGYSCAQFMLHSSEFMPGGSPYFPTEDSVERLYSDIESLFELVGRTHLGATLGEFRERYQKESR